MADFRERIKVLDTDRICMASESHESAGGHVRGPVEDRPQENKNLAIGVLALQGAFREHIISLKKCGIKTVEVRFPEQLDDIDGLVIPGGESTTINKLMDKYGFKAALKKFHESGKPVFGTCAGLIMLAREVTGFDFGLGFIDITADRNAYGRQIESFENPVEISVSSQPDSFNAIFIRAPVIRETGKNVQVLARHNDTAVLAKEGNVLVCTFHPELTDDLRIHLYFIDMVKKSRCGKI